MLFAASACGITFNGKPLFTPKEKQTKGDTSTASADAPSGSADDSSDPVDDSNEAPSYAAKTSKGGSAGGESAAPDPSDDGWCRWARSEIQGVKRAAQGGSKRDRRRGGGSAAWTPQQIFAALVDRGVMQAFEAGPDVYILATGCGEGIDYSYFGDGTNFYPLSMVGGSGSDYEFDYQIRYPGNWAGFRGHGGRLEISCHEERWTPLKRLAEAERDAMLGSAQLEAWVPHRAIVMLAYDGGSKYFFVDAAIGTDLDQGVDPRKDDLRFYYGTAKKMSKLSLSKFANGGGLMKFKGGRSAELQIDRNKYDEIIRDYMIWKSGGSKNTLDVLGGSKLMHFAVEQSGLYTNTANHSICVRL